MILSLLVFVCCCPHCVLVWALRVAGLFCNVVISVFSGTLMVVLICFVA